MSTEKELAYRYGLFVAPDWRARFDALIDDSVKLPKEGRILEVNCGTGDYAIARAEKMNGKGEVLGTDPGAEWLEIARAKAQVNKCGNVAFEQAEGADLPFPVGEFDAVIGDGSMLRASQTAGLLREMVRTAKPGARVLLKIVTHGSFDEFFSVYWESLLGAGIVDQVWGPLERMIGDRLTISDAEAMAGREGLRDVASFSGKEEFSFESALDFIESPLIKDWFLDGWLEVIPPQHRDSVVEGIISVIDGERHHGPFDVSIKATVISGWK